MPCKREPNHKDIATLWLLKSLFSEQSKQSPGVKTKSHQLVDIETKQVTELITESLTQMIY